MQHFAIIYPVGGTPRVFAYRVCFSKNENTYRVVTITADTSKTQGRRVLRTEEPEVWAAVRAALIEEKNIIFIS